MSALTHSLSSLRSPVSSECRSSKPVPRSIAFQAHPVHKCTTLRKQAYLTQIYREQCSVQTLAAATEEAQSESIDEEQKIRIKLKSYFVDRLTQAVDKIKEAAASSNARISGPVYLPTRRRRWTVLTSPHVNKDAREQFEMRTHSRLIDVKDLTSDTIDKLMNLDLPAGVDVEIKL